MFVKKKSISTFQFTLISQFFDIVYKYISTTSIYIMKSTIIIHKNHFIYMPLCHFNYQSLITGKLNIYAVFIHLTFIG